MNRTGYLILVFAFLFGLIFTSPLYPASATAPREPSSAIVQGAMLYDKWFTVLEVDAPDGNMPLWARQNTNSRSGADTWRCVTCHGWDYQGNEGANRSGGNFTGFPGVLNVSQEKTSAEIVDQLSGKTDPGHDFSPYLDQSDLSNLVTFLSEGLIDDNDYIDPDTLQVIQADVENGQTLYVRSCQECHGEDGKTLMMTFDGMPAGLGTLAAADPWRFLHKTRFGTPGTPMPIGYDLSWSPEDGRDVLAYAQSMPSGYEVGEPTPVLEGREAPEPVGGPAQGVFGGLLTAFGAMATSLGFAIILGAVMVGVILLIVWLLRGRK